MVGFGVGAGVSEIGAELGATGIGTGAVEGAGVTILIDLRNSSMLGGLLSAFVPQ